MATRRNVPEKTLVDSRDGSSEDLRRPSDTAPAVPAAVIYKLLSFTLAMVALPIGSYFMTVHTVFKGHASYAGGFAAVMANVVLIAYIIVAMKEDQSDTIEAEKLERSKKGQ